MCIGCREMKEKPFLIRITRNKEGEVLFDDTGKLPGRGAYVCKNQTCLQKALKNKGFEKAFKSTIPEAVMIRLSEEMKSFETK